SIERNIGEFVQRNVGVYAGRGLEPDFNRAHGVDPVTVFRGEPDRNVELAIRLEQRGRRRAAEGRLHEAVDVADVEPVSGRFVSIDFDVQIGLPEDRKEAEIGNAFDLSHLTHNLTGDPFQHAQIAPDDLDRVGSLDARKLLLDVVLNILREIQADPHKFVRKLRLQLFREVFFGQSGRPLFEWLERREQFQIVESGRVAAVVGPAMLRDHCNDFWMAEENLAQPVGERHARFQRYRRRHRYADPQIAFLQMRQELGAVARYQHADEDEKSDADRDHYLAVRQGPTQNRRINPAQCAHGDRFGLSHVLGKQIRREHGRDRKSCDQRPDQGVAVGPRHRIEDLALDASHREQRDERRYCDGGGEKYRFVDLQRARQNQAQAIGPDARAVGWAGRVGAEAALRELLQKLLALLGCRLEIAKHVLDHYHSRIDDDAEVDCPDG